MPRRWQQQPHLRSAVRDHGQGRERCRSLRAVGGGAASTQELVSARADHDHSVHGGAVSPPLLLVLVLVPPYLLAACTAAAAMHKSTHHGDRRKTEAARPEQRAVEHKGQGVDGLRDNEHRHHACGEGRKGGGDALALKCATSERVGRGVTRWH